MKKSCIIFFLLILPSYAAAAPALSRSEAQTILAQGIDALNSCATRIDIDDKPILYKNSVDGQANRSLQYVLALRKLGIVETAEGPAQPDGVLLSTRLAPNVDLTQMSVVENSVAKILCVKRTNMAPQVEIVQIDALKGGVMQWDGAVVYYKVTNVRYTELWKRFWHELGHPVSKDNWKIRVLFKFDPFKNSWATVFGASDSSALDENFTTDNVSAYLHRD